MLDERSRLRRRTSASSVESLGVVESSSSTGSAESGGEPCKCHSASHIGHINKETSASERKRRERARTTPLSGVSPSRSRSLTALSLVPARSTPRVFGFTSEEELEIKIASEAVSGACVRVRTPYGRHRRQAGPLTGSPSKRQAMKLPNIFEKHPTPIPFTPGQIILEEGQTRD